MRWWMVVVAAALLPVAAHAQDETDDPGAQPEAEDLLSEDELDALVSPVALYPDSLLTQLFVAATYPLDVMKADRFLDENADVADKERADLANDEDWDTSVKVLAGGFPDVIGRMADDIDWTEDLGDAMLAQTDDLLDAVQRMRAQAQATGNLASNEAQTVEVEGDNISIAPADPQVVYVPAYDPQTVYTTPVTQPTVVYDDPGIDYGSVLTTGAIAFGSALLIDEIFDDDDDWDNDYWYGPRSIDWDDDSLYPGGINVEGDVNVKVDKDGNVKIGDRDGDQKRREDKWEADRERRDDARRNIENRSDERRDDRAAAQRDRDGARDERRDDKIAAREERREDNAGNGQGRPDRRPGADRPGDGDGRPGDGDGRPGGGNARPGGGDARPGAGGDAANRLPDRTGAGAGTDDRRTKAEAKLKARSEGGGAVKAPSDRKPGASTRPAPDRKPGGAVAQKPKIDSVLKPSSSGKQHATAAKDRGAASLKRDNSPTAVKARAPSVSKPKTIAKPKTASPQVKRAPPRKPAPKATAFKKPKVSPSRSHASASRGKSSGSKMKRR